MTRSDFVTKLVLLILIMVSLIWFSWWTNSKAQFSLPLPPIGLTASYIDVQLLGLVPGSVSIPTSKDNTTKLNNAINDAAMNFHPFQFPGKRFGIFGPIYVDKTAHKFLGMGMHRGSNSTSVGSLYGTPAVVDFYGRKVVFDGIVRKATTGGGATNVINLVNVTGESSDVGATLRITGGNGFIPGTYLVIDATPTTWTLHKNCTNSGNADSMEGWAGNTLWKDAAYGTYYQGLVFAGRSLAGSTRLPLSQPIIIDGQANTYYTTGASNQLYAGFQFDGTNVHATAQVSNPKVITLVGRPVYAGQVNQRLEISSSSPPQWIPGTYTIQRVDTTANTWTLSGKVCNANASGLIGRGRPNLSNAYTGSTIIVTNTSGGWRPGAYTITSINQTTHVITLSTNLNESSNTTVSSTAAKDMTGSMRVPRAAILWHQLPLTASLNTGKTRFDDCLFCDAEVGIVFGRDLRDGWEKYWLNGNYTPDIGNPSDSGGAKDSHADNIQAKRVWFEGVDTAVYLRNTQSVIHYFHDVVLSHVNTGFYFERGGETFINGLHYSGGHRGSMIRIGHIPGGITSGNIVVRNFGAESTAPETNPANKFKALEMDTDNVYAITVTFENGQIDSHVDGDPPLFECRGGTTLILRDVRYLGVDDILVDGEESPTGSGSVERQAVVFVENCGIKHTVTDLRQVIKRTPSDDPNKVPKFVVRFRNCYQHGFHISNVFADAEFTQADMLID